MQRRFYIEDLQQFLRLVDAELSRACTLVSVGEAAAALGYCPERTIVDIEVWSASDRVVWTAAERASEKIPRPIHLRQVVAECPGLSFEERLWPVPMEGLRFLTVQVPEVHDQALLHIARGGSTAFLSTLRRAHPISLPRLVQRFQQMQTLERHRAAFLTAVEQLFGAAKAQELEPTLGGGSRPRNPRQKGRSP